MQNAIDSIIDRFGPSPSLSLKLLGVPLMFFLLVGIAGAKVTGKNRTQSVNLIVIHATGGPFCGSGNQLKQSPAGTAKGNRNYLESHAVLGIHFVVGRDGTRLTSIPTDKIANHAAGFNSRSIGIELVNRGDGKSESFPEVQINELVSLLKELLKKYQLEPDAIKGHSEIDNRTFKCAGKKYKSKIDPGGEYPGSKGNFPWAKVIEELSR